MRSSTCVFLVLWLISSSVHALANGEGGVGATPTDPGPAFAITDLALVSALRSLKNPTYENAADKVVKELAENYKFAPNRKFLNEIVENFNPNHEPRPEGFPHNFIIWFFSAEYYVNITKDYPLTLAELQKLVPIAIEADLIAYSYIDDLFDQIDPLERIILDGTSYKYAKLYAHPFPLAIRFPTQTLNILNKRITELQDLVERGIEDIRKKKSVEEANTKVRSELEFDAKERLELLEDRFLGKREQLAKLLDTERDKLDQIVEPIKAKTLKRADLEADFKARKQYLQDDFNIRRQELRNRLAEEQRILEKKLQQQQARLNKAVKNRQNEMDAAQNQIARLRYFRAQFRINGEAVESRILDLMAAAKRGVIRAKIEFADELATGQNDILQDISRASELYFEVSKDLADKHRGVAASVASRLQRINPTTKMPQLLSMELHAEDVKRLNTMLKAAGGDKEQRDDVLSEIMGGLLNREQAKEVIIALDGPFFGFRVPKDSSQSQTELLKLASKSEGSELMLSLGLAFESSYSLIYSKTIYTSRSAKIEDQIIGVEARVDSFALFYQPRYWLRIGAGAARIFLEVDSKNVSPGQENTLVSTESVLYLSFVASLFDDDDPRRTQAGAVPTGLSLNFLLPTEREPILEYMVSVGYVWVL